MANPLKKIRDWMEWRGLTPKDALGALVPMAFLVGITLLFLWGAWQA